MQFPIYLRYWLECRNWEGKFSWTTIAKQTRISWQAQNTCACAHTHTTNNNIIIIEMETLEDAVPVCELFCSSVILSTILQPTQLIFSLIVASHIHTLSMSQVLKFVCADISYCGIMLLSCISIRFTELPNEILILLSSPVAVTGDGIIVSSLVCYSYYLYKQYPTCNRESLVMPTR